MEPLIGLLQGGLYCLLIGAAFVALQYLAAGIEETAYDPDAIVANDMEYDVCEHDEFDDGWGDLSGPPEGFTDYDVDNGLNALERHANTRK